MMNYFLYCFFLLSVFFSTGYAQNKNASDDSFQSVNVETMAEFPGGTSAMAKFIIQNLHYPEDAIKAGLSGRCFLKFLVSMDGTIGKIEVLKGVPGCPDCDKEAIRMVLSMPRWKPATYLGKNIDSYYNLPLIFKSQ